jgi:hypothetical protein
MSKVEKLIEEIKKNSTFEEGSIQTNKSGINYQYNRWTLKYNHTASWLKQLFYSAQKEVMNNKGVDVTFHYNEYCFHLDRAKYKSDPDGKITMTFLNKLI